MKGKNKCVNLWDHQLIKFNVKWKENMHGESIKFYHSDESEIFPVPDHECLKICIEYL